MACLGRCRQAPKELEQSLREGSSDIAVHTMKDVTVDLPKDLVLPVIMQREDPREAYTRQLLLASKGYDREAAARMVTYD